MDRDPFASVLAALSRADVHYLLVGGVACALNGFVRTTEDIDILVERDEGNLRRLIEALATIGEGHAREFAIEDFSDEEGAVQLVEEFPIDIFTRMGGLRYADLLRYRRIHREAGLTIPFLDAEGLILLKEKSLRLRDRIDVEALREIVRRRAETGET